jgi:hypothetical protein
MWPSASRGFASAVDARRRLLAFGVACGAACFALALPPAASGQAGTVFGPSDQTPPKGSNPCPKRVVPNDVYDSFKDLLTEVLGSKAGVVSDIDAQVRSRVPDADEAHSMTRRGSPRSRAPANPSRRTARSSSATS